MCMQYFLPPLCTPRELLVDLMGHTGGGFPWRACRTNRVQLCSPSSFHNSFHCLWTGNWEPTTQQPLFLSYLGKRGCWGCVTCWRPSIWLWPVRLHFDQLLCGCCWPLLVVVDLVEVVTVIWCVTFIETAVLILPRPASHVSDQSLWLHYQCTRIQYMPIHSDNYTVKPLSFVMLGNRGEYSCCIIKSYSYWM